MKYIDFLVKKVLSESLNEKAEEITKKINNKSKVKEDECVEGDCGEMKEIGFKQGLAKAAKKKFGKNLPKSLEDKFHLSDYDEDDDMTDIMSGEFDYVEESECVEGDCGETTEELHGNQKKIDVAAPKGKITKADFDKLRGKK